MEIALLSCTSKKKNYSCKASELYSESQNFVYAYAYAKKNCEKIFILSAKHGLIHEDEIIEPYNMTLNDQSKEERRFWATKVLLELQKQASLDEDEFIIMPVLITMNFFCLISNIIYCR